MLGSRQMLLIGGVVGGVIVLGILATLLTSSRRDPYRTVCENVIQNIISGKYDSAYTYLSSSAKSADSKESWRSKMFGLANVYKKGEFHFVSQSVVANASNDATSVKRARLNYLINNPAATTDTVCFVRIDGKVASVDGFTSKVR